MATKEVLKNAQTAQKVQLVKGDFTHAEASHVINTLIDVKINFHKLQRLQNWEGDHNCETGELDGRIKELEKEKHEVKQFLSSVKGKGLRIKMDGIITIGVVK